MSEHTPWLVKDFTQHEKQGYIHISGSDGKKIADIFPFSGVGGVGVEAARENARLIAAAPDLLAALKLADRALDEAREMLGVFEDNGGHDGLSGKGYLATINHMDEARAKNRVAVEKATKGTQGSGA